MDECSRWLADRIMMSQTVRAEVVPPENVIAVLRGLADYELWKKAMSVNKVTFTPTPRLYESNRSGQSPDPALRVARLMHEIADAVRDMDEESSA